MVNNEPEKDGRTAPSEQRVTLRDIAKIAGVSHVSVSHALRGSPQVSAATRERIKKIAEEMGYRPDPMLSALSHYRRTGSEKIKSSTLAWINPFRDPAVLRAQQEFDLYWRGARDLAAKLGFDLEEFKTSECSLQRLDSIFKTRNIRGIIIASLADASDLTGNWKDFPWENYISVRFGLSAADPQIHHISSAQVRNANLAFQKAAALGYERIGFYGLLSPTRFFPAGITFAQLTVPEELRLKPLFYNPVDSEKIRLEKLDHWIKTNRPDAIITERPKLLNKLNQLGYDVPGDFGVATLSIHDTPINAGIDQNSYEVGQAAVRTIASLLNEQRFGIPETTNEILIEGKWVDGTMLPPRYAQ